MECSSGAAGQAAPGDEPWQVSSMHRLPWAGYEGINAQPKELMMAGFVPRVKLLQESYRLMEIKKLLRAYGIRDTNLLKDKQMIMVKLPRLHISPKVTVNST